MPVTSIDHLVLTVRDLERTVAWYGQVAGMRHITFGEGRHALAFGEQKINLHVQGSEIEPYAALPTPGSGDLCFLLDGPLDEAARVLREAGVAIELGPIAREGAAGALESLYVRDPDGNLVELSRPL